MFRLSDEWYEFISYSFGCISVLIWVCAQFPQILKNWRKKSVDGLSPGFLISWVAGDTSNLIGCLMTSQLGVQILLAAYFCLIDLILISQFNFYKVESADDVLIVNGYDPYGDEDMHDNSNRISEIRPRTSSMVKAIYAKFGTIVAAGKMVGQASAAPTSDNSYQNSTSQSSTFLAAAFRSLPFFVAAQNKQWVSVVGYMVAYFSMCMYLLSRIPQIYHNYQRKSTTGISMLLFVFALMGNVTYVLSIVLSPQCIGENANTKQFLMKEISYIMGAFGTVVFDCIILAQWFWYQRMYPRRRRSTAPLDRIQRPYLGALRQNSGILPTTTPFIQPYEPQVGSPPTLSLLNEAQKGFTRYGSTASNSL